MVAAHSPTLPDAGLTMGDQIVPVERIQRMAREAFERGESADSCALHPFSSAYKTWREEYAHLEAQAACNNAAAREAA